MAWKVGTTNRIGGENYRPTGVAGVRGPASVYIHDLHQKDASRLIDPKLWIDRKL